MRLVLLLWRVILWSILFFIFFRYLLYHLINNGLQLQFFICIYNILHLSVLFFKLKTLARDFRDAFSVILPKSVFLNSIFRFVQVLDSKLINLVCYAIVVIKLHIIIIVIKICTFRWKLLFNSSLDHTLLLQEHSISLKETF